MSAYGRQVWLSGERFDVDYLFDRVSGRVVRTIVLPEGGGTTAGMGRPCFRCFVAVYVAPEDGRLFLQVDDQRVRLNDHTEATYDTRLAGLMSRLSVTRPGHTALTARQLIGTRNLFLRHTDPGYDDIDRLNDDFLADVADIVRSKPRREWIVETKDAFGGPWDTVS